MAKVVSINISSKKGIPKTPIQEGEFITNFGLKEDSHGGDWHRQVSLLAQESIDKIKEMGMENLSPGVFAENITTEGICLYKLPIGAKMKIGESIHEVTQIGKQCHNRCKIFHTIGDCIMPKEGIFTKIIMGGCVKVGDIIEVLKD
ncbi:MOSC domain-containing protein [Alkaliphilus pronyensis]|uniref:MOSC domain-containing protein n=1 Tax=Alkaliphilus pronyensis TaxID=1482732 RepID=A0A6I0F4Y2_9FIRM|nr:MOSC domain-containing protein [Alkaliphilus pronyensis]KAB3529791.1 MOSC domain-containing protein [Alkaliphilus pronyensis]